MASDLEDAVEDAVVDIEMAVLLPGDGPHPRASLLGLPAELRTDIYREVLEEHDPIHMYPYKCRTMMQPGLLRTCRLIRGEASPIFHANNFRVSLLHLSDGKPNFAHWFWKHVAPSSRSISHENKMSWSLLKVWLRRYHEGFEAECETAFFPVRDVNERDEYSAGRHLFEVVKKLRDVPWETVESVLEFGRHGEEGHGVCSSTIFGLVLIIIFLLIWKT